MKFYHLIESIEFAGHGHYKIVVMYRGNKIEGISNNTCAYDRLMNRELSETAKSHYGYTDKQARQALRREVILNYLKQQK